MNTLVFDTETTGLPLWNDPSDHPDQPYIVDIAASLFDPTGLEIDRFDAIVKPGVPIPKNLPACTASRPKWRWRAVSRLPRRTRT